MLLDINLLRLLIITIATLLIGLMGFNYLVTYKQKMFFFLTLAGLFFYSGFGFAYGDFVSSSYFLFYCGFISTYTMGFAVACKSMRGINARLSGNANPSFEKLIKSEIFVKGTILIYLFLCLFSLIYPNMIIDRLWNLPGFDITQSWFGGLSPEKTVLESAMLNLRHLMLPLFLLSLYRYRQRTIWIVILIILPYYFDYCSKGYLGRTAIAYILTYLFIFFWYERQTRRKKILLYSFLLFPILSVILTIWSASRTGEFVFDINIINILESLQKETSFPIHSEKVLSSGLHTNITDYFMWILTLPLPTIFVGPKPSIFLTVEITEILENIPLGYNYFSIILTGPVTESVYIYGINLFWLHGLFVGILAGLLCSVSESIRSAIFIHTSFIIAFGFVFARAGIGGLMPILMNQFLSFYIILLIFSVNGTKAQVVPDKQYLITNESGEGP